METTPEPIKQSILEQIVDFVKNLFVLDDINYTQSIADIKSEVSFKGFNVWILICSILVCSLGLNMNSTAVVIGAMLISPLMGPIVGLGLGIGIFDRKLIFKAIKNIGVTAAIAILTAYVFFKITPTAEVPELLSRTRPTVLDLFVAFFGGIAGILAASRCLSTNVVPGVAIATALMPPLCTAGFGLAIGNMDYFLGAFYLFLMNCIMISLAAVIIILYLRYPKFSFVDGKTKRNVRGGIGIVVLLVSIPSIFFYYNLLQDNLNQDRAKAFIENEVKTIGGVYVNSSNFTSLDSTNELLVNISGKYVDEVEADSLNMKLENYGLKNHTLKIIQPQPIGFKEKRLADLKSNIIQELYQNNAKSLESKADEIALLKAELQRISGVNLISQQIVELAKSQYDIEQMAVDVIVYNVDGKLDTIPTCIVKWDKKLSRKKKAEQQAKMQELLKLQMVTDKIKVIEIN